MVEYYIVEFEDGVQLVPSKWVCSDSRESYWPKYTKQTEINNAIAQQCKPSSGWPKHGIKRILGSADSYEVGMEKLRMAEKYSDLDSDREVQKKNRKQRARKIMESDEDESEQEGDQRKDFPNPPKIVHIHSSTNRPQPSSISKQYLNLEATTLSTTERIATTSSLPERNSEQESVITELLKTILKKVNKLTIQIDILTNEMRELKDTNVIPANKESEEIEFNLPFINMNDLQQFENDLKDQILCQKLVTYLKGIGKGKSVVDAVSTVLKRVVTNEMALYFTFAGQRKGKECFKDLNLYKVILKVLRSHYPQCSEQDVNKATENWLIQAHLRRTRELNKLNKTVVEELE